MATSVHSRGGFQKAVASLPGVTLHEQWDALVAKVGGKVFALCGDAESPVVFKVSELAFGGLTMLDGIRQAAYFAKGQWVHVDKGAEISDADLKLYLREAHRIIAGKLTRKIQAELGLSGVVSGDGR
jgi:predicted DNA-binding protein (MmcQ/YjbR family)